MQDSSAWSLLGVHFCYPAFNKVSVFSECTLGSPYLQYSHCDFETSVFKPSHIDPCSCGVYKLGWRFDDLLLNFLLKVHECLAELQLDSVIPQCPFQLVSEKLLSKYPDPRMCLSATAGTGLLVCCCVFRVPKVAALCS